MEAGAKPRAAIHAAPLNAILLGAMLLGAMALAGCAGSRPSRAHTAYLSEGSTTHTVRRGEDLYRIALEYHTSVPALMAANNLGNPRALRVGQVLRIPGRPRRAVKVGRADVFHGWNFPRHARQFSWPVYHGVLSSGFGIRHGVMHDGIDIAAPAGTPVHAADGGRVIFTGRLRGYGNVVIIRHAGGFVTVYGHDRENFVREGETVQRGQVIGEIGQTGRTTGPNLHFEVRRDNLACNPLPYLPAPAPPVGITFARNGGS